MQHCKYYLVFQKS